MNPNRLFGVISLVVIGFVVYVIASGLGFNPTGVSWDFETTGQLGDSFGPLNTLMAAMAAIGALAAYFSQKVELEEARTAAAAEQRRSAKRDFETTFFSLISLFRDTTNDVEVKDPFGQNPVRGRDAISRIINDWMGTSSGNDEKDQECYRATYAIFQDDLGHYFRLAYHIIQFIDASNAIDKKLYVRIFRASLSNSEIILMALNCAYGEGRSKFKPLIEKYALLHNISESDAKVWRLVYHFNVGAFGDRPDMIQRLKSSAPK